MILRACLANSILFLEQKLYFLFFIFIFFVKKVFDKLFSKTIFKNIKQLNSVCFDLNYFLSFLVFDPTKNNSQLKYLFGLTKKLF